MPSTYTTTILITGGSSGLGWHTAVALSKSQPSSTLIVVASRSPPASPLPSPNVKYTPLDLSSAAGVKSFVASWSASSYPPISVLILNAGLQFKTEATYTADGIESTFGINHLGNAHLYHRLSTVPSALTPTARIFLIGSATHDPAAKTGMPDAIYSSAETLAHPTAAYPGTQRYATSKLCNILWSYALARRLATAPPAQRRTVLVFNPGLMPGTGLARQYNAALRWIWHMILPRIVPVLRVVLGSDVHTVEESAGNLAWMVGEGEKGGVLDGVSGVYYTDRGDVLVTSEVSREAKTQEELWAWTVKACAGDDKEREVFERGW